MSYTKYRVEAENQAKALCRRAGSCPLPVDPNSVCRRLGIKVQKIALDDELSGMAFVREGDAYIVVNARHHIHRQRFTMAHELAHHVLHASHLRNSVHVDKVIFNRNARSKTGEDRFEVEANAFAAELLMPRSELRKFGQIDINNDVQIEKLARIFKVSHSAMAVRLANLNINLVSE